MWWHIDWKMWKFSEKGEFHKKEGKNCLVISIEHNYMFSFSFYVTVFRRGLNLSYFIHIPNLFRWQIFYFSLRMKVVELEPQRWKSLLMRKGINQRENEEIKYHKWYQCIANSKIYTTTRSIANSKICTMSSRTRSVFLAFFFRMKNCRDRTLEVKKFTDEVLQQKLQGKGETKGKMRENKIFTNNTSV